MSGEEQLEGQSRERHEDHWDITTAFDNPWFDEYSADWCTYRVRKDEESLTNDELYENKSTQQWMSEVSCLDRAWLSILGTPLEETGQNVPYLSSEAAMAGNTRFILAAAALHFQKNTALPLLTIHFALVGRISAHGRGKNEAICRVQVSKALRHARRLDCSERR